MNLIMNLSNYDFPIEKLDNKPSKRNSLITFSSAITEFIKWF